MMLWKCCTQYACKLGKLNNGLRTGKGQSSLKSQRKAVAKDAQTTTQLYSSHTLVKCCSKFKLGFNNRWTMNFQMFKLDLQKAEEQRSRSQHPLDHWKSKRVPENISFCFIDYAKAFDYVDHNKLENSSRDGNTRPPDVLLEKSVCRSRSNS